MARGGARNRSGPPADPTSGRSDRRGLQLQALDSAGYAGEVPDWPLGPSLTDGIHGDTELRVWREAWETPQAIAWADEPWRWPIIAEYCRIKALVETSPGASAALVGQLHRYRDQIGFTPAGLRENGWQIAAVQRTDDEGPTTSKAGSRNRLSIVQGDVAG